MVFIDLKNGVWHSAKRRFKVSINEEGPKNVFEFLQDVYEDTCSSVKSMCGVAEDLNKGVHLALGSYL